MREPAEEQAPQLPQSSSQPLTNTSQQSLTTNQTAAGSSLARPQLPQRLCGWLEKRGGPLKLWKTRWFSHDDGRSLLLYWRTPQDATPLGQVELSSATFSYSLEPQEEQGTFNIHTPQRTFILKAASHELMMYWLQQLQLTRCQQRTQRGDTNTHTAVEFLPQVKMPMGFVGEKAANLPSPGQSNPLNISLKHPIIEFQNLCLRSKRVSHLDQAPIPPPTSLDTPTHDTANQETSSLDTPTHNTPNQESTSMDTPTPNIANQETASLDTLSMDTANQEKASLDTPTHNIAYQETDSLDTPTHNTANQETSSLDTPTHNTPNQESTFLDTPTHNTPNQESTFLDTPTHNTAGQETTTMDTPTPNTANQETASLDTLSMDTANQEKASLDTPTPNTANQETASLDILSMDTVTQETASLDAPTHDTANQETDSLSTPSKVIANKRPASLIMLRKICMGELVCPRPSPKAHRRKKVVSATLPPHRHGNDPTPRLELEMFTLEKELSEQKELVLSLYRALEASQREKRACVDFLSAPGEDQRLELLRHRERQVAKLQAEADDLHQHLRERDEQVCELQETLQLQLEKNQAKQEVVLKLSQQLADWASHTHADNTHSAIEPEEKEAYLKQEIKHLRDDLEAYRTQNKFLNSEIHHLTQLWRQSSQQEKSLMVKCAYLEACRCEKESQYLSLLQQLRESAVFSGTHTHPHTHEVRTLIEDALQGALSLSSSSEFDAYGFKLVPEYESADVKLLMKLNAVELRSRSLQQGEERPLVARWAQLLSSPSQSLSSPAQMLSPSLELKALLRDGVPQEFRTRVWRWLVYVRTRAVRERHPDRYRLLTQRNHLAPGSASHQIQLDLHRTLTTNQRFSSPTSPSHEQLRRVLLAFSCHNPTVGYCQGLNRLAAVALLVLEDEEEAFWCLVAIVEAIMPPDYYTKTLLGYQIDQCVFRELLAEKVPRVSTYLESHLVDVSQVSVIWFPVIFVELLPSDILLPLWDAFLYEGSKVIFRYALALLKYKEEEILKMQDSSEIFQYLFFFPKTITDARKLRSVAFGEFNPFPKKHLRSRRAWHRERLEAELREREAEMTEQSSQHAERHDKALDDLASDDDELN
ncbi:TBC1 domain family member 2A isoform X2 [Clupea harengus]|nr:TBC1 domain family member 2A isoform X2 [Clupea harengus]